MKTILALFALLLLSGCYSKYESHPEYKDGKWRWSEPKIRQDDQWDSFHQKLK